MTAASVVRVPMVPPVLEDSPPYLAEGAKGGEPKLVSPSQTHQGTKFSGGQTPNRGGQSYCKGEGH